MAKPGDTFQIPELILSGALVSKEFISDLNQTRYVFSDGHIIFCPATGQLPEFTFSGNQGALLNDVGEIYFFPRDIIDQRPFLISEGLIIYAFGCPGFIHLLMDVSGDSSVRVVQLRLAAMNNAAGLAAFSLTAENASFNVRDFVIAGGTPSLFPVVGTQAPTGETISNSRFLALADSGALLIAYNNLSSVSNALGGLFIGSISGGPRIPVVVKGQATGDGRAFQQIGAADMNNGGLVVFMAQLSDGTSGIFRPASDGTYVPLVRQGDSLPGGGTFSFSEFYSIALNDNGEIAFTTGGGLFFRSTAGAISKVVREGEESPTGGSFSFPELPVITQINSQDEVSFRATLSDGRRGIFMATPLPGVESVVFEEIDSSLDSNPNTGGGLRIFPDKQSPTDTINRRKVRVKATLTRPIAGVPVFFRSFDVDDPSSDTSPTDPNGPDGDDNNGTPRCGTLDGQTTCLTSAQTDAGGIAEAEFEVTMNPGDNFKVAASTDQAYLDGLAVAVLDLMDANGSILPTDEAKVTDMLTVWRKLHVEVDSIGFVSGNSVTGTILKAHPNVKQNRTTLVVNGVLEPGRFEKGLITIKTLKADGTVEIVGTFSVIDNRRTQVIISEVVQNTVVAGKLFEMVDDDDFNNDDGTFKDGDQGENVIPPDVSLIQDSDVLTQNVFARAYVRPKYDLVGNDEFVPFVLNTPGPGGAAELIDTYRFDNRASEADPEFWTVYLLGAYQYITDEDNDPDGEGATLGIVDDIGPNGVGASVFKEVVRPEETTSFIPGVSNDAVTSAHEIGHLLGGEHGDGGLMGGVKGGVSSAAFSDVTISKIRKLPHP